MTGPLRVVVMGVAGSGKSTVGVRLAAERGAEMVDADSLHSEKAVAAMASGLPLDDDDRWAWLARVRGAMRSKDEVVVACSALKRSYRDVLRAAGAVRFVFLAVDEDECTRRIHRRHGHYMGASMVPDQFRVLEVPGDDERDVVTVDGRLGPDALVAEAVAGLDRLPAPVGPAPLVSVGGSTAALSSAALAELIERVTSTEIVDRGAARVLLVPPDQTRFRSRAGAITALVDRRLRDAGCEVGILPALGTHAAMTDADIGAMFGAQISSDRVLEHRWRTDPVPIGVLRGDEVDAISGGARSVDIEVAIDRRVVEGWDLVVSVGQVVPHEVIGMANFTKNLVIGLGGSAIVQESHLLGAVCDMETVMGRASNPVRDVVDTAFDRFVAPKVETLWILTVVEDTAAGVVLRGLFVGRGGSARTGGAAFRAAAALSAECNITVVPTPLTRVSCWLDEQELTTTWVGNKAIYRTRMALAAGAELLVLAPGVRSFGEDGTIDALIRRHGYRGTDATRAALRDDPELAANLGAAAHLIHGSSEGRFRIVYCTDPETGGLTQEEVESVGYGWRSLRAVRDELDVGPDTPSGRRVDRSGQPFEHVANPALGLWTSAPRSP